MSQHRKNFIARHEAERSVHSPSRGQQRKNFIAIDEGFTCKNCGKTLEPLGKDLCLEDLACPAALERPDNPVAAASRRQHVATIPRAGAGSLRRSVEPVAFEELAQVVSIHLGLA